MKINQMFGDGVDYYCILSVTYLSFLAFFFGGFLGKNRYRVLIADSAFSVGKIMASGVHAVIIPPNCALYNRVFWYPK